MVALGDVDSGYAERVAGELRRFGHRVVLSTTGSGTPGSAGRRGTAGGVDVVHTLSEKSLRAVAALRSAGTPVVHSRRPGDPVESCAVVDHVVVGSRADLDVLIRSGVPRSATSVVVEAVDNARWSVEGPVRSRTKGFRVVCRDSLWRGGGADTAIAALPWVPNTELVLAGRGGPRGSSTPAEVERLSQGARALRVADRVRIVGRADPALVRSADVVVQVPWTAGSTRPVIEAMACGVPVVVSTVGGLPETVLTEVTGLVVPPRDPKLLGLVLRRLLTDKVRLAAFSIAAADRVEQRHTWARFASGITRAYREVVR
ncbi:hypothetical protein GCM10022243_42500 [Saccharothrix violaceirubra]